MPTEDPLFKELLRLLHQVFTSNRYATFLTRDEKELLTKQDPNTPVVCKLNDQGYPPSPLISQLASFFRLIIRTGTCPIANLPYLHPFDEDDQHQQRIVSVLWIREQLQGAHSLWDRMTDEQKVFKLAQVISRLRRRGLLDFLQLRRTTGSIERVPIPRQRLIQAAEQLYHPKALLTVCARARDKHIVRDSTERWGQAVGSVEQKNDAAQKIFNELLDNAIWVNIHELAHSLPTLEIREPDGYGLRFDYEPLRFRGFLEPQQKEGWLNRYRH